jgi:hypothetical protein
MIASTRGTISIREKLACEPGLPPRVTRSSGGAGPNGGFSRKIVSAGLGSE